MIQGSVTPDREAVIPVVLQGENGQKLEVRVTVDTGFNLYLMLPTAIVSALGWPAAFPIRAGLADGQEVELQTVRGTVIWDGEPRSIVIIVGDGGSLVGMGMLYGLDFFMGTVDGGPVTVTRRSSD